MGVWIVPANEYRRLRWRNGAGWTREIVCARVDPTDRVRGRPCADFQAAAGDWDFRLSIAEIERDGAYSAYPGIDRQQVLLSGAGFELRWPDGRTLRAEPPRGRLAFAGEQAPECRLLAGPAQAFNVFTLRRRAGAQVLHRPLVGAMVFFPEPGVCWAAYLVGGRATIQDGGQVRHLEAGDTLMLRAGAGPDRAVLDGAGELLLVKIATAGQAGEAPIHTAPPSTFTG